MNINLTLIGQSLTFLFFIAFCMRYVWPALLDMMEKREDRITKGLQAADRADKDLELAKQQAAKQLKDAKDQAVVIIDQANKRAAQIVEEAKDQARSEGERIKTAAHAEVEQEINQAREALRGKVSVLALAGAEKILGASVDAKVHSSMLEKLSAEL
ncbi:MAG: F0F1 ATP synthase subunit B [Cellvibrionaceae bacterium]|nr:F0F1 ATP synthase subunit B [Cellvibrionaceae bacterium]